MSWLRFNERKATQVAGKLLAMAGGRMAYFKLIKLLYFIDRNAILRWGRPVTTDRFVSMPHGPVVSRIYDLICSGPEENAPLSPWHQCIGKAERYDVELMFPAGDSELSRAEERLIDEIFVCLGEKTKWQLRDMSHDLPEWRDPGGSSLPLEIEDILRADGRTEHEIAALADELQSLAIVQSI
ncbi:MAG: Panacea domain-containing protein [Bryobacteraceae bacterium]